MDAKMPVVRCTQCETPWVLRVSLSLSGGDQEYVFQRDCKHRTPNLIGSYDEAALETATLSGVLPTAPTPESKE